MASLEVRSRPDDVRAVIACCAGHVERRSAVMHAVMTFKGVSCLVCRAELRSRRRDAGK